MVLFYSPELAVLSKDKEAAVVSNIYAELLPPTICPVVVMSFLFVFFDFTFAPNFIHIY